MKPNHRTNISTNNFSTYTFSIKLNFTLQCYNLLQKPVKILKYLVMNMLHPLCIIMRTMRHALAFTFI